MLDNSAELAQYGVTFGLAQILDLLGETGKVEIEVRTFGFEPAQPVGLRLGPGVEVRVVELGVGHGAGHGRLLCTRPAGAGAHSGILSCFFQGFSSRSEEQPSDLTSLMRISYAVF